jgi:transcriptional regulator with XRE-family HTH domain
MVRTAALRDSDVEPARAYLGAQLRRLREARRITRADAACKLSCDDTKISRVERGDSRVKDTDLDALLTFYGVTDRRHRDALLALARRLTQAQWWQDYRDVVPGWLHSYLVLESIAETIRTYEPRFIPGPLQTEDYALALVSKVHASTAQRRVELRLGRRRTLLRPQPGRPGGGHGFAHPRLWAIIDESALAERIGGPRVMREQLEFLSHATSDLNVQIQILPSGTGGSTGIANSFSLLRLPTEVLPDLVYIEHLTGAQFIDDPHDVDTYRHAIEQLGQVALEPRHTSIELEKAMRRLERL